MDILAMSINALAYPSSYLEPFLLSAGVYTFKEFNYTARHKDTLDTFRRDSLNTYVLMKNSYEQHRNELIKE